MSARPDLPADLRRFIVASIPSVPYLETILLLRAEKTRTWTAATMARRLYLPETAAADLLTTAADAGLAVRVESQTSLSFRYGATDPHVSRLVEQLAEHYGRDIVAVTGIIHSRVDRRAEQFANAFRLRKDS